MSLSFPVDGDDSGHGGYRVFIKLRKSEGKNGENSVRRNDGTLSHNPDNMWVLRVI